MMGFLENMRIIIYIITSIVLFGFETFAPSHKIPESRFRHIIRNLFIAALNSVLTVTIASLIIAKLVSSNQAGLFNIIDYGFAFEIISTIILLDFVIYLWHILVHKNSFLWRFHKTHHTDLPIDFSSSARFHVVEIFFSLLFHTPIYLILGLSLEGILAYQVFLTFFTLFAHGNILLPKSLDKILSVLFITPNIHKVHHSRNIGDYNTNFGTVFSIWDKIFRSYKQNTMSKSIRLGIEGYDKPQTIVEFYKA